ncbi:hypothetical protein PR202_gb19434 [Eleusine coracana subsp. coracana]|uniref:Uncharacterized protein n=1 Tax=Eleusine coracana subsp. coracana TaxID=191504 RepID=A0AAV5F5Z1_ELECO|nr:hypothetical protein PR202_gb19434 [Eleusine coracana subsp. coracana]
MPTAPIPAAPPLPRPAPAPSLPDELPGDAAQGCLLRRVRRGVHPRGANPAPGGPLESGGRWLTELARVEGGVTAAKGFKAAGIYGGLRAKDEKPDLALVACDVDATVAGAFTTNAVAAAPVLCCKHVLGTSKTAPAVLINAGQANAATGDASGVVGTYKVWS